MKRFFLFLFFLAGCGILCLSGYELKDAVDTNGTAYQFIPGDPFSARFYTLSNGMKLYLARNAREPRIQTAVAVRAGSADDPASSTGLAHYFEHMMFKGNDRISALDWEKEKPLLDRIEALFEDYRAESDPAKRAEIYKRIDTLSTEAAPYSNDEYWTLVQNIGARQVNAYTSLDQTVYISDIPSSSLEKYLYLESVRFSSIALRRFHTELETVYEEFNMMQDNDQRLAYSRFLSLLFPKHPYGRNVIGLPAHIKAPSMRDIKTFFADFYRPDNMALILSGDLDYDRTAALAEQYFGRLKPMTPSVSPDLRSARNVREEPVSAPRKLELSGPRREQLILGFRFDATPENERMLTLIGEILQNGKCGLFDKDLILPQKVQTLSQGTYNLRDYFCYLFNGEPKQGQTLEDLYAMIFRELDKLKNGDFPDWLPAAVVNNLRLSLVTASENRQTAYRVFVASFIREYSMADALNECDEMEKITRQQIMDFARKHFSEQTSAAVFKRTGEPSDRVHAEKPPITPVEVPAERSPFFAQFEAMRSMPEPEPVFPDFKKELILSGQSGACRSYWIPNRENERFSLSYVYPAGSLHDLRLPLAFGLAPFLGLNGGTAEGLQEELYKLAGSISFSSDFFTSRIRISGLERNREAILKLIGNDPVWTPDEKAWEARRLGILKARENARKDTWDVFDHASRFALYGGPENLSNLYLPEEELMKLTAADLTGFLNDFVRTTPCDLVFYSPCEAKPEFPASAGKESSRKQTEFLAVPPTENRVFFVDYPMVQAIAFFRRADGVWAEKPYVFAALFGEYAHRNFWVELRERNGIAYSAGAFYSNPTVMPKDYSTSGAYVRTQPDKLVSALDAMLKRLDNPVADPALFRTSKENILSQIRNSRIHPESFYDTMKEMERLGLKELSSQTVYRSLPSVTQEQFLAEWKQRVSGRPYCLIVIGDAKKVDPEVLKKFGPVTRLSLDQIYRK